MGAAIEVEHVSKRFGSTQALDDVSLSVGSGRVLALLGPNGAGKTTLVRVLTTLLQPDSGRARVAGLDVRRDAKTIRTVIGLAGQYATVDELLTGRENLELVGLLYHLDKNEYQRRAKEALERMTLTGAGDKAVKTYSGGMRRRLDLAASLIGRPPDPLPRRTHHRARPADEERPVGAHRGAGGRGHDRPAHDPVHGGSRASRSRDRRDGRRAGRGPWDGRRAEGPHGRQRLGGQGDGPGRPRTGLVPRRRLWQRAASA